MHAYYTKLNDMKAKAMDEQREAAGEKPKKVADVSKLVQKPVVKVAVKIGKH